MIEQLKTVDCPHGGGVNCPTCVGMCARRPCWGTPDDARKLIAAGYGPRLMRDYWSGGGGEDGDRDIHLLSPAIAGKEGREASFSPFGRCTFLTPDGFCELHDLGLKPTEGRAANCEREVDEEAYELHHDVAFAWNSLEAQVLVEEWQVDRDQEGNR